MAGVGNSGDFKVRSRLSWVFCIQFLITYALVTCVLYCTLPRMVNQPNKTGFSVALFRRILKWSHLRFTRKTVSYTFQEVLKQMFLAVTQNHRWRKCYLSVTSWESAQEGRFSLVLHPDWSWFQYCHLGWFGQMCGMHLLQWPASLQISWQFLTSRTWVSFPGFSIGRKPQKPKTT